MKKQIFTLAMCLALTATTALAQGANGTAKKIASQPKVSATTALPVAKSQVKSAQEITAKTVEQPKIMTREEAKKRFEQRQAKERELLYSTLNLTNEQKVKAEELDAKTRTGARNYIKKVHEESRKLRDLKAKKASFFAVYKQEFVVRRAKSDTDKFFRASRKSFEAILTDEQKAKFKLIGEARRKEMKNFKKEHRHEGDMMFHKRFEGEKPLGQKTKPPVEKK